MAKLSNLRPLTEEEDAQITRDALDDPDNPPLTDEELDRMQPIDAFPELARLVRPGRPLMAAEDRKQRVTMYLDRDVLELLKKDGRGWQTRANEKLREALGLTG